MQTQAPLCPDCLLNVYSEDPMVRRRQVLYGKPRYPKEIAEKIDLLRNNMHTPWWAHPVFTANEQEEIRRIEEENQELQSSSRYREAIKQRLNDERLLVGRFAELAQSDLRALGIGMSSKRPGLASDCNLMVEKILCQCLLWKLCTRAGILPSILKRDSGNTHQARESDLIEVYQGLYPLVPNLNVGGWTIYALVYDYYYGPSAFDWTGCSLTLKSTPTTLYLIEIDFAKIKLGKHRTYKVGITQKEHVVGSARNARYAGACVPAIRVLGQIRFSDGRDAYLREQKILCYYKRQITLKHWGLLDASLYRKESTKRQNIHRRISSLDSSGIVKKMLGRTEWIFSGETEQEVMATFRQLTIHEPDFGVILFSSMEYSHSL